MNVLAVNDQSRAFGPGFFVGARGFRVEPGGGRWVVGGERVWVLRGVRLNPNKKPNNIQKRPLTHRT